MSRPDVIVIGAGIFGLSTAWALRAAGAQVQVLEAKAPGSGASGGIVGALTPHAPGRWRPMMAFQFQALLDLPERIAQIEIETGLATGYAQIGRLTPLTTARMRTNAEADVKALPDSWAGRANFRIIEHAEKTAETWLSSETAPFGLVHDTLSARVAPRAYIAALARALGPEILDQAVVKFVHADCRVETQNGVIEAEYVVIANGWQASALLKPLSPALCGTPVKGQAALIRAKCAGLPLIYHNGIYIIPHANGTVSVGSTSEKRFTDAASTDAQLDRLIEQARSFCPRLRDAPVIERWVGLRPKPPGREPVIGPLPESPKIWLATGGYKIGFGIAHAVGDAIAAGIMGTPLANALPESFAPGNR